MDEEQALELHSKILEQERQMENRALTALGHFLTANAFMFAAWAAFYASLIDGGWPLDLVLGFIALVGYAWGIWWARLGTRNWGYARRLVAKMHEIGRDIGVGNNLYTILAGVERDTRGSAPGEVPKSKFSWTSHWTIVSFTPLSVSTIYLVLAVLWMSRRHWDGELGYFASGAVIAAAVIFIVQAAAGCMATEKQVEALVYRAASGKS
jgi:hypothetical protein